jgi:hypothetical protein
MTAHNTASADSCPLHGHAWRRATCRSCNAAYMRAYLRRRRHARPVSALLERARSRARRRGLPFSLRPEDIAIPARCPALGIPLQLQGVRSANSPSLDRLNPAQGYVGENVRVISDRANRLKGDRTLSQLKDLAGRARSGSKAHYELIVAYVENQTGSSATEHAYGQGRFCLFERRAAAEPIQAGFGGAIRRPRLTLMQKSQ